MNEHLDHAPPPGLITLFFSGDVMTGRGIDQILPNPNHPTIYEPYIKDARRYVDIAEKANGPIPRPVDPGYIWGDALEELERVAPDLRIINLETSITKSDDYWKGKGINYRMHPDNIDCLTIPKIDVCSLANNHVLDWGYAGLMETLETLRRAQIKFVGAGENRSEAESPLIVEIKGRGRLVVFGLGSPGSGIPLSWAASREKPGVHLLREFSEEMIRRIRRQVQQVKQDRDLVIFSIHWGSNWGYDISKEEIDFAHRLIDNVDVNIIHGHSSHHVKGMEVYRGRLILYGCGDFLNDYEGIGGFEYYRSDLGLMYFVKMDPSTGGLVELEMVPTQIRRFQVNRASTDGALWLAKALNREGTKFGTGVVMKENNVLKLVWGSASS